jgi:hypothetical protein
LKPYPFITPSASRSASCGIPHLMRPPAGVLQVSSRFPASILQASSPIIQAPAPLASTLPCRLHPPLGLSPATAALHQPHLLPPSPSGLVPGASSTAPPLLPPLRPTGHHVGHGGGELHLPRRPNPWRPLVMQRRRPRPPPGPN